MSYEKLAFPYEIKSGNQQITPLVSGTKPLGV